MYIQQQMLCWIQLLTFPSYLHWLRHLFLFVLGEYILGVEEEMQQVKRSHSNVQATEINVVAASPSQGVGMLMMQE